MNLILHSVEVALIHVRGQDRVGLASDRVGNVALFGMANGDERYANTLEFP